MEPIKQNVLVLCPTVRDEYHATRIDDMPADVKARFCFYKVTAGESEHFDLLDYTEMCEKVVVDNSIQHTLSVTDIGALVHAALAQKFPHISGPSMESVLLTFHKYYTRMYLDLEKTTLKHAILDAGNVDDETLKSALLEVGIPGFIKPCTGTGSFGVSQISSINNLKDHITWYNDQSLSQSLARFIDKYSNKEVYPKFANNSLILEEFVDGAKTVTVDGCIFHGEILHWQITENVYWKSNPSAFMGVKLPFEASENLEVQLWAVYDAIVGKAIDKGFNNQFIDVEAFVRPNGDIKIMEVNPRMFAQVIPIYRLCTRNGDPMVALLNLTNSDLKPEPCVWNGQHGFNGYVITFATGKAGDLLDFEEAAKFPEISLLCSYGDEITNSGEAGANLAFVNIAGSSREDVIRRHLDICKKILKKPEFSPRLEYGENELVHTHTHTHIRTKPDLGVQVYGETLLSADSIYGDTLYSFLVGSKDNEY